MGGVSGLASSKEECMDCLRVFYGVIPYDKHQSRSSGSFYNYMVEKYGKELVAECEKELYCPICNGDGEGPTESMDYNDIPLCTTCGGSGLK